MVASCSGSGSSAQSSSVSSHQPRVPETSASRARWQSVTCHHAAARSASARAMPCYTRPAWPGAHWGIYAGDGFIIGAVLYAKLIELFAYEAIMNRDSE